MIIDNQVCYLGGLDLCFGRYDTPEHKVNDCPSLTWPGKDYYNPRFVSCFFKWLIFHNNEVNDATSLSHPINADDILIITKANLKSLGNIKEVIKEFAKSLDLKSIRPRAQPPIERSVPMTLSYMGY